MAQSVKVTLNFMRSSKDNEELAQTILILPGQGRRCIPLMVDGDDDQNVNLCELHSLKYISDVCGMVLITTESAAIRKEKYGVGAYNQMDIRTEDHLLPWVVFCRNAGSDLVCASSAIWRIAVQIVEECRDPLHAHLLVARLLNIQDVEIWEHTLQRLRSVSPDVNFMDKTSRVMVNAFMIFWETLDLLKKHCLKICPSVFGNKHEAVLGSYLTYKWTFYGLQTEQAAEELLEELLSYSILRTERSFLMNGFEKVQLQEEICETLES